MLKMKAWQKLLLLISAIISLFLSLQIVFYLHLQVKEARGNHLRSDEVVRIRANSTIKEEKPEDGDRNDANSAPIEVLKARDGNSTEISDEAKGFQAIEEIRVVNPKEEATEKQRTELHKEQAQKMNRFEEMKRIGELMPHFPGQVLTKKDKNGAEKKEGEEDGRQQELEEGDQDKVGEDRTRYEGDVRVAVIIPYVGYSLPVWFDTFAESCRESADIADWLIFHDERLVTVATPPNVKLINLTSKGLATAFSKIVEPVSDQKEFARILPQMLNSYAYMMVEFKPAYGYMFEEHLTNYSHWAYADLDLINGNLIGWTDEEEFREYDIFTFSFGDQFRAYARGQLTIHRNTARVNHIWHGCSFMKDIFKRVRLRKFHYQSGEGCYSSQIAQDPKIRMKYSVKVFSDVGKINETQKEVIYSNGDVVRCPPSVVSGILAGQVELPTYSAFPIQISKGPFVPAELNTNGKCMFWVDNRYQHNICLTNITGLWNLFLEDKTFYKQEYINRINTPCWNGAFFHFQDWKNNYRYWSTRPPPPDYSGLLMSAYGFVPLPPKDLRQKTQNSNPTQLWAASVEDRHHTNLYCLNFDESKKIKCTEWLRLEDIYVIKTALKPAIEGANEATLAMVGHMDYVENFMANVQEWGLSNPKILILYRRVSNDADALHESINRATALKKITERLPISSWENSFVAVITAQFEHEVYSVALNMAKDLCKTRFLIPLPQHMVLSKGARMQILNTIAQWENPGMSRSVGIIPQWSTISSCDEEASSTLPLSFEDLEKLISKQEAWPYLTQSPAGIDVKKCTGLQGHAYQPIPSQTFKAWQKATELTFDNRDEITWSPCFNLTESMNCEIVQPSLLLDLWSYRGANWVRYVEELGAFGCGGSIFPWTLRILGYDFFLVPEVFTVLSVVPSEPENMLSCRCFKDAEKTKHIMQKVFYFYTRVQEVYRTIFGNI